ncbi:MAG: hypothetical protein LBR06_00875 [Bacteroidales bacterium]|nr:hypothetical protein [Bacteroidales bacterium]
MKKETLPEVVIVCSNSGAGHCYEPDCRMVLTSFGWFYVTQCIKPTGAPFDFCVPNVICNPLG